MPTHPHTITQALGSSFVNRNSGIVELISDNLVYFSVFFVQSSRDLRVIFSYNTGLLFAQLLPTHSRAVAHTCRWEEGGTTTQTNTTKIQKSYHTQSLCTSNAVLIKLQTGAARGTAAV